ncbi:hypothetical protein BDV96DRAFT_516052 [Lophiotrema nucula]|uniref:Asl1-like glycosyl hydrolase catalytic domain-containing protein n=1 Tax=Lophiotrema nucula TaxID=690887 RepID=A0A6A5ZJU3_9PLEO|nr:hypothetical protein BDV96DRAFT_516052 [Lophiotrema nucula]
MFSNSKVSWMYNWGHNPGGAGGGFEYVPMLWSNREQTSGWHYDLGNLIEHGNTQHLLGFNEADGCSDGGSCMPDARGTAMAYKAWFTILKQHNDHAGHNYWLGSPSVTNGNRAPDGSKMGLDWLSDFLGYCSDCQVDFIAIHWYDQAWNFEYFKNYINKACEVAGGRYVWVTEFSPTDGDENAKIQFLRNALPFLDGNNCIEKYAMFMAEPGKLISGDGNGLSALGSFYSTF